MTEAENWPFPEAVEYELAHLNDKVAFIIDDHLLPYSAADKLQTKIAGIHLTYEEYYRPDTAHAIYEFNLQNTTTKEKTAFSLVMCPVAATYDSKIATVFTEILRGTVRLGVICAGRTPVAIASRSLCSFAVEKEEQIEPSDVKRIVLNLGSGYFYFESHFNALNSMFQDVLYPQNGVSDFHIMRKECPYCANLPSTASPG